MISFKKALLYAFLALLAHALFKTYDPNFVLYKALFLVGFTYGLFLFGFWFYFYLKTTVIDVPDGQVVVVKRYLFPFHYKYIFLYSGRHFLIPLIDYYERDYLGENIHLGKYRTAPLVLRLPEANPNSRRKSDKNSNNQKHQKLSDLASNVAGYDSLDLLKVKNYTDRGVNNNLIKLRDNTLRRMNIGFYITMDYTFCADVSNERLKAYLPDIRKAIKTNIIRALCTDEGILSKEDIKLLISAMNQIELVRGLTDIKESREISAIQDFFKVLLNKENNSIPGIIIDSVKVNEIYLLTSTSEVCSYGEEEGGGETSKVKNGSEW